MSLKAIISKSIYLIIGVIIGLVLSKFTISTVFNGAAKTAFVKEYRQIAPDEVSNMIKDYRKWWRVRTLRVQTKNDGKEDAQSILIPAPILSSLKSLAVDTLGEKFLGIALNLARNSNGATTIITAIVDDGSKYGKHLIPPDDFKSEKRRKQFYYDHLDICPDMCPSNQPSLVY